jgi:hypothetical protein
MRPFPIAAQIPELGGAAETVQSAGMSQMIEARQN